MELPALGHHLSICIDVKNIEETVNYYKHLGFKIYSGGINKGWCTITDGTVYFALFTDNFIQKEFKVPVLFNYRGGNMGKIIKYLETLDNISFEKKNDKGDGTGDSIIVDPNGFKLYFDTTAEEERVDE